MIRDELEVLLREVLAHEMDLSPEEVRLEMSLREELDLNSLDATNVLMTLEDRLKVEADLEDFLELQTVGDLLDYMIRLVGTEA
ncbi:MAG: acyl carrier protein [bacterium]|jgi:acyl carrier protein